MTKKKLGILHPGNMGISIAASALNSGCEVYWASEGRSAETRARAEQYGLRDAGSVARLCQTCAIIVSVCPPHAAEDVAEQVAALRADAVGTDALKTEGIRSHGFYLDANAISPQRAVRIGERLLEAGITFVDGGIVGGPAWQPGETWLYLSGGQAPEVVGCFSAGPLETAIIGDEIGQASALKMCYAAWTKGSTALLSAILAASQALDVQEELLQQWARDWPDFDQQAIARARRVTAKAWRFAGEMDEISSTFAGVGLPGGFHDAAGEVYRRMAHLKGAPSLPSIEEVMDALLGE
jgi:3-hydroxyisobutyrate dehydrogenase-like beta-hydroxyacid dehydrogenase